MKLFVRFALIVFSIPLFQGCVDLDLEPLDQVSAPGLFSEPEGVEASLKSTYEFFSKWYKYREYWYGDTYGNGAGSNHLILGGDNPNIAAIASANITPDLDPLAGQYGTTLLVTSRANDFLYNLLRYETPGLSETRRAQMIGEAKFLRALFYFKTVKYFGGVPIVTEDSPIFTDVNYKPIRNTEEEVFEQMIQDAQSASELLPTKGSSELFNVEIARPTKETAWSLLGHLYMSAPNTIRNYSLAAAYLDSVEQSGKYTLLPNFDDLFDPNNKMNSEAVFQCILSDLGKETGGNMCGLADKDAGTVWFRPPISAYLQMYSSDKMNSLGLVDLRRDATMVQGQLAEGTPFYQNKFRCSTSQAFNQMDYNAYEYRYADILLLRAEALAFLGYGNVEEVLRLVNMIRERAFGYMLGDTDPKRPTINFVPYTSADYPDQLSLINLVIDEREKELYLEAKWYPDLKRAGLAKERLGLEDYQLTWPLPQSVLDRNSNLKQTTGWGFD